MKTVMSKEQEINSYMTLLDISRREAEKLWEDDHSDEILPEVAEMERKAKQLKRYEKSDAPRKKTTRERKIDPDKLALHSILANALKQAGIEYTPKNEAELHFTYCGNDFTVKLIKHRAPK